MSGAVGGRPVKGDRPVVSTLLSPEAKGAVRALTASTGASQGEVTGALVLLGLRGLSRKKLHEDLTMLRDAQTEQRLITHAGRVPRALVSRARKLQADTPGSSLRTITAALLCEGIRRVDATFSQALADASALALDPGLAENLLLPAQESRTGLFAPAMMEVPIAV